MLDETSKELRRIRLTLVILVIIVLFTSGNHDVTEDFDDDYEDSNQYNSNMVPLEDGYFGVLTNDTYNSEQIMKVYYFDKTKKELNFVEERDLFEFEEELEH